MKKRTFIVALALCSLLGCSESVLGPDASQKPEDNSLFGVDAQGELFVFGIAFGDPENPDSSHLALARFSDPLDYRVIATAKAQAFSLFTQPQFNPSKSHIAFSSNFGPLSVYSVLEDSTFEVSDVGFGFAYPSVSWINDSTLYVTRYEHQGGIENFVRSLSGQSLHANNRYASLGGSLVGTSLLLRDVAESKDVIYNPISGSREEYRWEVESPATGRTFFNHLDYSGTSDQIVREYRFPTPNSSGPLAYQILIKHFTTGETQVFAVREGTDARYPTWVTESEIVFVSRNSDNNRYDQLGESLQVFYPKIGLQDRLISVSEVPGSVGLGMIDY